MFRQWQGVDGSDSFGLVGDRHVSAVFNFDALAFSPNELYDDGAAVMMEMVLRTCSVVEGIDELMTQPQTPHARHIDCTCTTCTLYSFLGFIVDNLDEIVDVANGVIHSFAKFGHYCGRQGDINFIMERVRPLMEHILPKITYMQRDILIHQQFFNNHLPADLPILLSKIRTPLKEIASIELAPVAAMNDDDLVFHIHDKGTLTWITTEERREIDQTPKRLVVSVDPHATLWVKVAEMREKFVCFLLHTHERDQRGIKLCDDVLWEIFNVLIKP